MKIFNSAYEFTGNTPLIRFERIEQIKNLNAKLIVKAEMFNPSGSVKDRAALNMIKEAEKSGRLKKGGVIIEPTSGNTGIGLASAAAQLGYKLIIAMPETMSAERRQLMKAYGAELVLTEGSKGMKGAIEKAKELQSEIEGSIIAGQFENPANPAVHYETTGPEIWADTDGKVDIFIAGVGTGGTLSGTGKYLKEKNPDIKVIAVEPEASPVLSGGSAGPHPLQGIGAGFVPDTLSTEVIDEVITVSGNDAYSAARLAAKNEGLLTGVSSGAALAAAIKVGSRKENQGKLIVAILPDTGERYLSTPLYAEI